MRWRMPQIVLAAPRAAIRRKPQPGVANYAYAVGVANYAYAVGWRIASSSSSWRRTPPQTCSHSSNTLGSLIE